MMSRPLILFLWALSLGLVAQAAPNDHFRRYKLLPLHYEPAHAAIVQERLAHAIDRNNLPATYRIPKDALPDVQDQGERGTCAYFATLGLLETYLMKKSSANKGIHLSEECLADVRNWMFDQKNNYSGDDKPLTRPDPDGDMPDSIIKTIRYDGVPLEAKYGVAECRYEMNRSKLVSLDSYREIFSSGSNPSPAYGKDLRFDLNTAPTIQAIKELIAQNIPVEVGILVYKDFFYGSSWLYRDVHDHSDSNIAGGHAVILTGYHTWASGATNFIFKNSWGLGWGGSGYGELDDKLLIESWKYESDFDFIVSAHD